MDAWMQENEQGTTRVVDAGSAATCITNCRDCNLTLTGRATKLVIGTLPLLAPPQGLADADVSA
jgi:hypothetical protein